LWSSQKDLRVAETNDLLFLVRPVCLLLLFCVPSVGGEPPSDYSLATTKHPTQHTHLMQRSRRPPGRSPSLSRRRLTSIAMLSFTLVCFLCISCFCSSASASPSPSSSSIVPPLSRWSVSSVVSSDDECVVSGSHNLTFGLLISGW
jgi:hypothetical protein